MKTNIHIYPAPFQYNSRILNITNTLKEYKIFDKIIIFGSWKNGALEREDLDETRVVISIKDCAKEEIKNSFLKFLKILRFSFGIVNNLKQNDVDCINCHSLPVLPLCVFLKFIKRARLIYDTHELETESFECRGLRKVASKIIERILIDFVDVTVVVSDSIAEWYKKKYGLKKLWVIKNVLYINSEIPLKTEILREMFNIRQDEIIFLYQGLFSPGRGIDLLLNVFSKVKEKKHIIFMGYGEMAVEINAATISYQNIHCLPAVKPEKISLYSSSADIGFCFIENVCLSYYLTLPTKMLEYIRCGIPVIVSNFPELSKIIDAYGCGWKIPVEENALRNIVDNMTKKDIDEKKKMSIYAKRFFDWRIEELVLLNIYQQLGFSR